MNPAWYFVHDGKRYGPFTPGEMQEAAIQGLLYPEDVVQHEATGRWLTAGEVPQLRFPIVPPSRRQPPPIASAREQDWQRLREIARWHRVLMTRFLVGIVFSLLTLVVADLQELSPIFGVFASLVWLVAVYRLACALDLPAAIWAVLSFVPVVNLLLLFTMNRMAVSTLRRAGLEVGLLGADLPEDPPEDFRPLEPVRRETRPARTAWVSAMALWIAVSTLPILILRIIGVLDRATAGAFLVLGCLGWIWLFLRAFYLGRVAGLTGTDVHGPVSVRLLSFGFFFLAMFTLVLGLGEDRPRRRRAQALQGQLVPVEQCLELSKTEHILHPPGHETEARKLGETLRALRLMGPNNGATVRLRRDGQKWEIHFFFPPQALADPALPALLREWSGVRLAGEAFPNEPVAIHLCDEEGTTQQRLDIGKAGRIRPRPGLDVWYRDGCEEAARRLSHHLLQAPAREEEIYVVGRREGVLRIVPLHEPIRGGKARAAMLAGEWSNHLRVTLEVSLLNNDGIETVCVRHAP